MIKKEQLDAAIGAHGMWKNRLKSAIASGKLDTPVEDIRTDRKCAFGLILFGNTLDAETKASEFYKKTIELHKRFHEAAAGVAELVKKGDLHAAEFSLNGSFSDLSVGLTGNIMSWKRTLTE